jgi:hypothetical protein
MRNENYDMYKLKYEREIRVGRDWMSGKSIHGTAFLRNSLMGTSPYFQIALSITLSIVLRVVMYAQRKL